MTHHWRIRLWMAAGMFLIHFILGNGISAQPAPEAPEHGASSKDNGRLGINVSEFTDINALGFLSPRGVTPWGRIVSRETDRSLLAQRDAIYVAIEEGHDAKPGDLFSVFDVSSYLNHPLSGRGLGYVIGCLGRVVLKSEVTPRVFKADIVKSYRPMQIDSPVIPFQPLSPCIQLISAKPDPVDPSGILTIPVVAAKDLARIIGQYSVVYLNHGHQQGVYRGNLFQVAAKEQPDHSPGGALPNQGMGYVLILEAGPDASTGLVITATQEFYMGAMLKSVDLTRTLGDLMTYYGIEPDPGEIENNPLHALDRLKEKVGPRIDLPDVCALLSGLPRCPLP